MRARSCAEFAELRSAYVDGALADADRERLLAHLVDCAACRATSPSSGRSALLLAAAGDRRLGARATCRTGWSRSPVTTPAHRCGPAPSGVRRRVDGCRAPGVCCPPRSRPARWRCRTGRADGARRRLRRRARRRTPSPLSTPPDRRAPSSPAWCRPVPARPRAGHALPCTVGHHPDRPATAPDLGLAAGQAELSAARATALLVEAGQAGDQLSYTATQVVTFSATTSGSATRSGSATAVEPGPS